MKHKKCDLLEGIRKKAFFTGNNKFESQEYWDLSRNIYYEVG
jgi:hypothetical protein